MTSGQQGLGSGTTGLAAVAGHEAKNSVVMEELISITFGLHVPKQRAFLVG